MKKKLILLLLLVGCFINCNSAYALDVKSSDYEIVETEAVEEIQVAEEQIDLISETDKIKILKKDGKYFIIDKESNELIIEPIIDELSAFNDNEYKIKVGDLIGYLNVENKVNFLTKYDDITLLGDYIKTKKFDKYGLLDKDSNLILMPIYEKISIFYSEDKEYISGKYEGKYKLFQNTGRLIPEEELYSISNDGYYTLAQDLKPEFKKYRLNNSTVYEKIDTTNENLVYEIEEIELPDKVKTAAIEKNIIEEAVEEEAEPSQGELLTLNDKKFILVKNEDKYGLNSLTAKEILPAVYDSITPVKLCDHYKDPILLTNKNGGYAEYDVNGKLLAEQVYDKVNIYKYGKLYTYAGDNGEWVLRKNGKEIGVLTHNNNCYKFTKTAFHLLGLHKINELFIAMLENAK